MAAGQLWGTQRPAAGQLTGSLNPATILGTRMSTKEATIMLLCPRKFVISGPTGNQILTKLVRGLKNTDT